MTRTPRWFTVLAAAMSLALFALAAPASAVTLTPTDSPLAGSNFQGGDGNQADPGADVSVPPDGVSDIDWQSIASTAAANPDDNVFDTAFAGGTKESEPGNWSFITEAGGVNPDKDNLLAAWSQSAPNSSGDPNTFLNLAFTREAQTGNTFITFELNQSSQQWNNGVADRPIACRTTGDLLISYEVASGGSPPNVDIVVYRWVGDTFDAATGCSKTGHFEAIDPQPNAEAAVNKDAIVNYLSTGLLGSTFASGTFGEASLNLTGILRDAQLGVCENFGQISMHTRSSTSIDSQLQDYIAPAPVIVQSCGIKVVKTGESPKHDNDPETFTYDVTNTGSQPVSLDQVTGVVDDKCSPVVYDSGDTNDDGMLDTSETWAFHCSYTVNHEAENADHEIVNTVTASGNVGDVPVSDSDTFTTLVIHPDIAVDKVVDKDHALAGDTLSYTITVENTGDTKLFGVTPSDVGCDGFDPTAFDLDPGAKVTLTCTKVVPGGVDHVDNTASAAGTDVLGEEVSDDGTATTTIDKHQPTLTTTATDNTSVGHAISDVAHLDGGYGLSGQSVSFTVYGPNDANCTGEGTAVGSGTIDENGDAQSPDFAPTAAGVYRWVASYAGDDNNLPVAGECNDRGETSTLTSAALAIVKTGPDHAYDGDKITFDITVSNPGSGPVEDVRLSDLIKGTTHGCDSISGPTGDTNDDGALDPSETWHYTCMYTVQHSDEDSTHHVDNVATVSGKDQQGDAVGPASDDASVLIVHPAIALDKTGPISADPGDKVAYTLTVTNPGDESFAESTLVITDAQCNGDPVTLIGKGGDTTPGSFDPGDVWTYSCSVQTTTSDITIHNVASVTAADQFGKPVGATATADTLLVLGERLTGKPKAAAKLLAPTGCVGRAFNARVRGTNIATVVFYLDGKKVKTLKKPDKKGLFQLRVNPKRLKIGVHRLVANITFRAATGTKPKTVHVSFQRCGRQLVAPRFTG